MTAMNEAKKMIVGRTWNANMNPKLPVFPGEMASVPKTNFAPSEAKEKNRTKSQLMELKRSLPAEVRRTRNANANWRTNPTATKRQRILRRSLEKAAARAVTSTRPIRPRKRDAMSMCVPVLP